jgi:hypothetical protein
MRKILILAAAIGLVFAAGGASAKDFKITKQQVKRACGDNIQGGGKNFGCTKCGSGRCRDYSCNGSGEGRQGCWETVLQPQRSSPDHGRPLRATSAGHGKVTSHVSPTGSGHRGVSGPRTSAPMQKNLPMATRSNAGGSGHHQHRH